MSRIGKLKKRADHRYKCEWHGKYFYGKTDEEAKAKREQYKKLVADGMQTNQVSVYDYALEWLPNAKAGIRAHTYNGYAKMIDYLCMTIGTKPLSSMKPSDIKSVYSTHYAKFSDSHIRHAKNLYTAMFDSAVDDGYIRVNPCRARGARPHKGPTGTHRPITTEERYYIETTDHPVRRIAMLMLYAGLRDGEAIPIDIDRDVDFDEKVIHVRYFRHIEHNKAVIEKRGKNDYAARDIKLFPQLEKVLVGHHGLALSMEDGGVLTDCAWRSAWAGFVRTIERRMNGGCQRRWYGRRKEDRERKAIYDRLMAEGKTDEAQQYKLPPWKSFTVKPYDLRHSFTCMCRDLWNIDVHTVMTWLGHTDLSMILRIYDHVSEDRINAEFKKVCDAYNNRVDD